MSYPEPYLTLYNSSAAAIKAVSPRLRVGGPATAGLAHGLVVVLRLAGGGGGHGGGRVLGGRLLVTDGA